MVDNIIVGSGYGSIIALFIAIIGAICGLSVVSAWSGGLAAGMLFSFVVGSIACW